MGLAGVIDGIVCAALAREFARARIAPIRMDQRGINGDDKAGIFDQLLQSNIDVCRRRTRESSRGVRLPPL